MKTPRQGAGGFTEKTLLVKNLLVLSFHYPINISLCKKCITNMTAICSLPADLPNFSEESGRKFGGRNQFF